MKTIPCTAMALTIGKKAPTFSLKDKDGVTLALKDVTTPFTVLFFYPKDSTPGCSIEAGEFSRLNKTFKEQGITVIGISGGNEKSKAKFCSLLKLDLLLLSDTDFSVATKYAVYGEKKFMGKTYLGIDRVTYVLNQDKKIIQVFENVQPLGHAKEVLTFITSYKE